MMKNKNKNDASAPISNHIDQNFQYLKPNASNIQKSKVIANNQFPRTVRLSIPEMKEKAAFNESSKNIGCVTYKEPRKEQSPENLNLNSGKILSNKMKSLYVNAENEKRRSKSPFLDEKSLIDGIKNAGNYYRNMKENMQNEKKIINYENQREEKIFVKDILRGNFFKESHNKSNSVHQISYDIKNLLKNVQNQSNKSPINPNIIHHSSISQNQANMIKTMNKYSNNPENRIDNNCNQHDKERTNNLNIINYKEDIAETPFASLAKEKNQKKNLANEVPVSFFVNHLNLKNLKISSISPNQNFNYENGNFTKKINKTYFNFS